MPRRQELLPFIYVLLVTSMNISLYTLGEKRVDAYLALNVLLYFISYAVVRPFYAAPLLVKALNASLLLVFALIVAFRVYEVLF
ncbi:MAG: hypothetical protein QXK88_04985 [Desulfurococcaceae archaeon]